MASKITLNSMVGDYPNTLALKKGEVKSDLVDFKFADVKVANTAFKRIVRDQEFDFAELAIVTYLQAKANNKPYILLPAVVVGRGQLHTLAYNSERGVVGPKDLEGKRVGVRAYSVTTGVYVRGMLNALYGLDINKVKWVTFEDPHVAEYRDPAGVERAPAGKELAKMVLDGELDAGIVGDKFPDPRFKTVVPDAEGVNRKWAETHGGIPINHMTVVRESLARSRPDVVRELYRMLLASKEAAKMPGAGTMMDQVRFGIEANRASLDVIIDFALKQGLIPRRYTVDELFDDTTRALAA